MGLYYGTSAQGTDHYTSSQKALMNGAVVGPGVYLMEHGDSFKASLVDANTVRLSSGLMLVNGREAGVEGHHDVVLENGAPGVSRIAKVVLRLTTGAVEGIEAKVYQGTPTAGEPEVPEHAEASLWELGNATEVPICTVRIDGIVPQEPVMLLPDPTPSRLTLMEQTAEALDGKAALSHSHGTADILDRAITGAKIADGAITGDKIAAGAVSTADLANASVTTDKLAALAVTAAKIAAGAVTLDKLAANSVNASKIVDGSVGTAELAANSVTNAKIAAGTIAFDRLASEVQTRITNLETFRDSVSQRLWAGTLNPGGSVTISGLSACKVIGLEFSDSMGNLALVRYASGNREFSLLQVPVDASNWVFRFFFGRVNISGNVLKSVKCGVSEATSTGLGNAFTLTGGDNRAITAVWHIL